MIPPLRTGPWNLSDLTSVPKIGRTVFSCFHCGGGSTMGYKLAGYDVVGGVDIDPEMMKIYRANHNPRHSYLMSIRDFNKIPRTELPAELLNLDILDGSPPCSSFSTSGSREKGWGEKKKFREGQSEQVLDDLFFHFLETARILQPKIVVAENVKGLVIGKAKGYVKQIVQLFNQIGYDVQLFLLNSAFMGVPQRRERTFFIARKRSANLPEIKLEFQESPIPFSQIDEGIIPLTNEIKLMPFQTKYWAKCQPGKPFNTLVKNKYFNTKKVSADLPLFTLASGSARLHLHHAQPRSLTAKEWIRGQTFPDDYNFLNSDVKYTIGMSVPPFMMQRVALEIYKQLLYK